METLSDAELARIAYGRAADEPGRVRARDAALELDRRRSARLEVAGSPAADSAGADETATTSADDAPADSNADDSAVADSAGADSSGADSPSRTSRKPRARLVISVVAIAASLLAIGVTAQLLTPRPSLEIFDSPASADDETIASRLAIFDPEVSVRIVAVDDESTFFAALSTVDDVSRVCVGIFEFDALTLVQCIPVEEFTATGMQNEIPLSAATGGLRIGDGFRYSWGPTGSFTVERLPPAE